MGPTRPAGSGEARTGVEEVGITDRPEVIRILSGQVVRRDRPDVLSPPSDDPVQ
jgi:hypothetical protein